MQFKTRVAPRALLLVVVALLLVPGISTAQVKGPAPYVSEMRQQCIAEMAKDKDIQTACKAQYSDEYHEADAKQVAKNHKHVVMAYAALWAIVTIFVVAMWLRQRKLTEEIARLEEELKKAAAE
jgi:hypothetical protein